MTRVAEPTLADVRAAAERIAEHVRETPLVQSPELSAACDRRVWLKLENRQVTGSFKPRGAVNAALRAASRSRPRGLITYSSGNHGQAVAFAAAVLGVPATVVAPTDVRAFKRRAMEDRGARVLTAGLTSDERKARAEELARDQGLTLIPPYDHPDVVAGQGTIGLEIAARLPDVDVACVPIGGGGLGSGISVALAGVASSARVVGVEPEGADDARRSLEAGELLSNDGPSRSACDGLRNTRLGDLNWRVLSARIREVVVVGDGEVAAAVRRLEELGFGPVEPSGAASVAAVLGGHVGTLGGTVVAVVSGGNVEPGTP